MKDDDLSAMLPSLLPRLWCFAVRLSRNSQHAEDLVKRACACALAGTRQRQAGTAWLRRLYSIIFSLWINEVGSMRIRAHASVDRLQEELANNEVAAAQGAECTMALPELVRGVDALPDAQRVVLLLIAVEHFKYWEVAEVLNLSIGTVMSRFADARLTLGQMFSDVGAAGERLIHPCTRLTGGSADARSDARSEVNGPARKQGRGYVLGENTPGCR